MSLRALDLFCGAGGATKGLQRAGFHVTGVDIKPQPRYCGDVFIQGDALAPPVRLEDFDLVWASPPCQAYSSLRRLRSSRNVHPRLIHEVRALIRRSPAYVIENVCGSPLLSPITLQGSYFGLGVHRPRLFECSFALLSPPMPGERRRKCIAVYGKRPGDRLPDGVARARDLAEGREAMGIDWMEWPELTQAIPPAYSHHIGYYARLAIEAQREPGQRESSSGVPE